MWRASLNRSIKEVRFVLKQTPEHHGVWNFVFNKLPDIRMLNQNTFFSVVEINDNFKKTESACHILYGDVNDTEEVLLSAGLSAEDFERELKKRVEIGLKLERFTPKTNAEADLPVDIVEARKYVRHIDDAF